MAAVVISYQSADELPGCLEALSGKVETILVVDNASKDDSVDLARRGGAEVLELKENTGFAGGCNAGWAALKGDFEHLAFFNPDVRVESSCLARCRDVLENRPRTGCVAPLLLRPDGSTIDSAGQCLRRGTLEVSDRGWGERLGDFPLKAGPVLAACGALAVFRSEALASLDEGMGPWAGHYFCFWEDLELGWRLNAGNWEVFFDPEARAVHMRGAGATPGNGPLRWRRPPELEACILTNRWMTLLRHLHPLDLFYRAPLLLGWDLVLTGAGIIRRPRLAGYLIRRLPLVLQEFSRRKDRPRRRLSELPC